MSIIDLLLVEFRSVLTPRRSLRDGQDWQVPERGVPAEPRKPEPVRIKPTVPKPYVLSPPGEAVGFQGFASRSHPITGQRHDGMFVGDLNGWWVQIDAVSHVHIVTLRREGQFYADYAWAAPWHSEASFYDDADYSETDGGRELAQHHGKRLIEQCYALALLRSWNPKIQADPPGMVRVSILRADHPREPGEKARNDGQSWWELGEEDPWNYSTYLR